MTGRVPRPALQVAAAAALTMLLAGCAGTGSSGTSTPGTHAEPAGDLSGAARSTVKVGLFEWSIVTAPRRATPGRVRLVVTNTGGTEHDLDVAGRDGHWQSPTLEPGEQATMTVRAEPGETLQLWCAEPGHRAQGMHTILHVAGK